MTDAEFLEVLGQWRDGKADTNELFTAIRQLRMGEVERCIKTVRGQIQTAYHIIAALRMQKNSYL